MLSLRARALAHASDAWICHRLEADPAEALALRLVKVPARHASGPDGEGEREPLGKDQGSLSVALGSSGVANLARCVPADPNELS